jgi:hypothetical protein
MTDTIILKGRVAFLNPLICYIYHEVQLQKFRVFAERR